MNPRVSICIPTFDRPDYAEKAVLSCLAQTYADYEIIVTDNSDNDLTRQRIESLRSPKVRYHKNTHNLGGIGNLTRAVSLAQGEFVKLLMDDDLLAPECIELSAQAFDRHPAVGVVMAPLRIIDEFDRSTTTTFYLIERKQELYRYRTHDAMIAGRDILADFLMHVYPCCVPSGLMYRRRCFQELGTFKPRYGFACDVELCMRFAKRYDFFYVDRHLARWRHSPSSDTVNLHRKGIDVRVFYALASDYVNDPEVVALLRDPALSRKSYAFATKRSVVAILSAVAALNPAALLNTLRIMWQEEPHKSNFLRLPWLLAADVARSFRSWINREVA